jgi:radical SAM family RiPP maturation amino acid epimerase
VRGIAPLLEDLSEVPPDHIRDVAGMKRFLERWTMDPSFQEEVDADPEAAAASLGLSLTRDEVIPLIDNEAATRLTEALHEGRVEECPLSVRRYRAYYREKRIHRRSIRAEATPSDARLAAWRRRQISRCVGELGVAKADALVHAPAAFELSKGCTVGCWFCGVAAPRYDTSFEYNDENSALWRGTLASVHEVMGACARQGFLYWATDPLDNPDYERFLVDFHEVLGRCPQTTTAQAWKDLDRTRRLLSLAHSLDSAVDRFSIITLKALKRVHEGLTAEEMLRVECVPQNKEAGTEYRKANAGRARKFAEKRADEMARKEDASTIACVSGFLFNMPERTVKMVTPCTASDRWPLGYWVIAEDSFDSSAGVRDLLEAMVEEHARTSLRVTDRVALRDDLSVGVEGGAIDIASRYVKTTISGHPQPEHLASLLADGTYTAHEIALRREAEAGVPLTRTMLLLNSVFEYGLIAEEPPVPVPAAEGIPEGAPGAR